VERRVVDLAALDGAEEVGDAEMWRLVLARVRESHALDGARLVSPDHYVVAVAVGGEVAVHQLRHEDAARLGLRQLRAQLGADSRLEVVVVLAVVRAVLPLVAEQSGLVHELGDLVDAETFHHARAEEWRHEHPVVAHHFGRTAR